MLQGLDPYLEALSRSHFNKIDEWAELLVLTPLLVLPVFFGGWLVD